ncbi:histidine kinase [Pseudomonas sp. M47T1]|uniref:response regulator n=1 Tax=Pseudomonas sp. M47T1 TaxID=1179778 RepID=UPI0002608101|nr:response regulator [Pseudomonas sp. M47T1]EIK93478.1 histidine kinase [Pseudomonas sp. M47T1]
MGAPDTWPQALRWAISASLNSSLPGGLNGRQVADAARQRFADVKVLFITGYAQSTVLGEDFTTGLTGVVTKPFTLSGLEHKVAEMLGRRA